MATAAPELGKIKTELRREGGGEMEGERWLSPCLLARRDEAAAAGSRSSGGDAGFLSQPKVDDGDDMQAPRVGGRERGEGGMGA